MGTTDVAIALVSDISGMNGLALPATFSAIAIEGLRHLYEKRSKAAKHILLDELRSGDLDALEVANEDAVWESVDAFYRAAVEGSAREALRLMARAMRGTVFAGEVTSDEFLSMAPVIATLTRQETVLLAAFLRARKKWVEIRQNSQHDEYYDVLKSVVVPNIFPNQLDLAAACSKLQRTGFVVPIHYHGDIIYGTTSQFKRLVSIAHIEGFDI